MIMNTTKVVMLTIMITITSTILTITDNRHPLSSFLTISVNNLFYTDFSPSPSLSPSFPAPPISPSPSEQDNRWYFLLNYP